MSSSIIQCTCPRSMTSTPDPNCPIHGDNIGQWIINGISPINTEITFGDEFIESLFKNEKFKKSLKKFLIKEEITNLIEGENEND